MKSLVELFRRETTSKTFIPVIDGLRFLAISSVAIYHVDEYLLKSRFDELFVSGELQVKHSQAFQFGFQGVELFFVISGFILAIPFMKFYLGLEARKPRLGVYYLRRLTRLEPPYILTMVLCFLWVILLSGGPPTETLIKSLGSSLLYIHNFVFPGKLPLINAVVWTLEIEVQYYLLAPLIVGALCKLRRKMLRRSVLVSLIIFCSTIAWVLEVVYEVKVLSLVFFLQYFLAGILLCDLYLTETKKIELLDGRLVFLAGLGLLVFLIAVNHVSSPNLVLRTFSPLLILSFYLIAFGNSWWRSILSLNLLTLIGGMCYSIYLLHLVLIYKIGRFSKTWFFIEDFEIFYWLQMTILLALVLGVSACFFLLVEKPCMKHGWHNELYRRFKNLILSRDR